MHSAFGIVVVVVADGFPMHETTGEHLWLHDTVNFVPAGQGTIWALTQPIFPVHEGIQHELPFWKQRPGRVVVVVQRVVVVAGTCLLPKRTSFRLAELITIICGFSVVTIQPDKTVSFTVYVPNGRLYA